LKVVPKTGFAPRRSSWGMRGGRLLKKGAEKKTSPPEVKKLRPNRSARAKKKPFRKGWQKR